MEQMGMPREWATWQLLDSLLPTGAFAHSLGLESALRLQFLSDNTGVCPPAAAAASLVSLSGKGGMRGERGKVGGPAVRAFVLMALSNVASQLLPFVTLAHISMNPPSLPSPSNPESALEDKHSHRDPSSADRTQQRLFSDAFKCIHNKYFSTSEIGVKQEHGERKADMHGLEEEGVEEEGLEEEGVEGEGVEVIRSVENSVECWAMLDAILNSCLTNHVARRASCSQGQALLRVGLTLASSTPSLTSSVPSARGSCGGNGEQESDAAASSPLRASVSPRVLLCAIRTRIMQQHQHQHQQRMMMQQQEQQECGPQKCSSVGGSGRQSEASVLQTGGQKHKRREEEVECGTGVAHGTSSSLNPSEAAAAKGHHATVFGALSALLGIPLETSIRAYLFSTLRDILSAATRLNLIGPLECASLQASLAPEAESMLRRCQSGKAIWANEVAGEEWECLLESVQVQCPILDLLQSAHDYLPLRLFLS